MDEDNKLKLLIVSYRRLPKRVTRFPAMLLYESDEGIVSLNLLNPSKPLVVDGSTLLDKGYIGVWFVSTRECHNVGAIYDREKNFKGYYCDISTPIRLVPNGYEVTDFFLDLWVFPNGEHLILDQGEFNEAIKKGWLTEQQIKTAKAEIQNLINMVKSKQFPPSTIKELLILPKGLEEITHKLERLRKGIKSKTISSRRAVTHDKV